MKRNICSIAGCRSYIMAKGFCAYHLGGYLLVTAEKKGNANNKKNKSN